MTNIIHTPEHTHSMLGVDGRMFNRVLDTDTGLFRNQRFSASKTYQGEGYAPNSIITVNLRFDDECRNGHQSFGITADIKEPEQRDVSAWGCLHDDIARNFPDLAPLIKWHLTSTDGPMHYASNAAYLAGDLDYNGLEKGERRQIRNGGTGQLSWNLVAIDAEDKEYDLHNLPIDKNVDAPEQPNATMTLAYRPWCRIGEGKERELDAARSAAVWPGATDEQLSVPRRELEAALQARLPALIAAFRADMEACGFLWEQPRSEK